MLKNTIKILVLLWISFIVVGCAYFGNEKQYEQGDWYGLATPDEVAKIKQNKLALEKMQAIPAQTAYIENGILVPISQSGSKGKKTPAGFKGKVCNLSSYNRVHIVIKGPEVKGFYLGPGQNITEYLIPGVYTATPYVGSRRIYEPRTFHVNSRTHNFMGEELHWYVYYE